MTVYYVDPYAGSDASTGVSWANAWRSFSAIRTHAVILSAGDSIRVAKSPIVATGIGDGEDEENYSEVSNYWRLKGAGQIQIQDSLSGEIDSGGVGVLMINSGHNGWQYVGGLLGLSDGWTAIFYNDGVDKAALNGSFSNLTALRGGGVLSTALTASGGTYQSGEYLAFGDARATYAVASGGEYNVPLAKLFSAGTTTLHQTLLGNIGIPVTIERLSSAIRCFTKFSGDGDDKDMPAGSLCLKVEVRRYVDQTLLQEVYSEPLPTIRNSEDVWTPFSVNLLTPISAEYSSTGVILDVYLCRTAMTLDRDVSPFGLAIRTVHHHATALAAPSDRVYVADRGPSRLVPYGGLAVGDLRQMVATASCSAGAMPLYMPAFPSAGEGIVGAAHSADNARLAESLSRLVPAYVEQLMWRGVSDKGVFDLGDTTGGSSVSPIVVSGGWDTSTNTRDGITYFSGSLPPECTTSCALFDLHGADHFRFEYIGACGGFSSFFTRARTVHLKGCALPFSFKPGFGEVTVETHVKLEDMCITPYALEGFGRIGNYSLVNVYAPCDPGSTAERSREVADFYMNDSHFGMVDGADGEASALFRPPAPLFIRGNAVVENNLQLAALCLVSVDFGHTLTFINPRAVPLAAGYTTARVQPVWPHPESRWDKITYASHPTYMRDWTSAVNLPLTFGSMYPSSTCDEVIDERNFRITFGGRWLESSVYLEPGNFAFDSEFRYVGNANEGDLINGLDGWPGPQTLIYQGRPPGNTLTVANRVSALFATQVSTPPLDRQTDNGGVEFYTTDDPQVAATGTTMLARKYGGVSYRSEAEVFLCVPYSLLYYPDWPYVQTVYPRNRIAVLKVIYVPRAGSYTANFGFMKENLRPDTTTAYVLNPWPVSRCYDGAGKLTIWETPNSLLGSIVARVNGKPIAVPYRASTAAEIAGNGSNKRLDKWVDISIDFEMSQPGDVRLELWSDPNGAFTFTIFDVLEIVERV